MEINVKYNSIVMCFNNSSIENKLLKLLFNSNVPMIYNQKESKYLFTVDEDTFMECFNIDKCFEHEFYVFDCNHPYLLCNKCEKIKICQSKFKFIRGDYNE